VVLVNADTATCIIRNGGTMASGDATEEAHGGARGCRSSGRRLGFGGGPPGPPAGALGGRERRVSDFIPAMSLVTTVSNRAASRRPFRRERTSHERTSALTRLQARGRVVPGADLTWGCRRLGRPHGRRVRPPAAAPRAVTPRRARRAELLCGPVGGVHSDHSQHADMRAASMIVSLTLAQAAWYPASRQSQFRSRP
jgi:hypothetical protein